MTEPKDGAIFDFNVKQYNGPRGWETFLATDGKYVKKYESSQHLFWYLLLAMTAGASFAFLWLKA
jgi:hypothetical protein